MRAHDLLIKRLEEVITLANELSKRETDQYARCVEELIKAEACLERCQERDKSAECVCRCHTDLSYRHAAPCGCYSGNPKKE